MSGMGNSFVSLNGKPDPMTGAIPYDVQIAQLQRQQKLADALQQQSLEPIQSQPGGAISWTQLLAKALQGVAANTKEHSAEKRLADLGTADSNSASDLVKAFMAAKTNTMGTPGTGDSQASIPYPQVPGVQGPTPQAASVNVPGIPAQAATSAPDPDKQLALLLAARGGPQTDSIRNALMGQAFKRQDAEMQNQMPLSQAGQDQIRLQGDQTRANAVAANQMPQTPQQIAQDKLKRDELAETRRRDDETGRYHDQMTGQGLTADGLPNPAIADFGAGIASGNLTPGSIPAWAKPGVAHWLNSQPNSVYSPLAGQRLSLESNRIVGNLMKLPQYELTANGLPYVQRIATAMQTPGSVTDQDLLDSLTKLNTSGNAITDAQVRIITDGKSYSDWAGTIANKFKSGGVLSDAQRQQVQKLANATYQKYKEGYQPVYDQAVSQLKAAGVPEAFWTIPNLNKLNDAQTGGGAITPNKIVPPSGAGGGGAPTIVRTGIDKKTGQKVTQYSDGSIQYAAP